MLSFFGIERVVDRALGCSHRRVPAVRCARLCPGLGLDRADMARTLPEGDPRYATDFLPTMDGAGCPPGGGAPQVHGGLAAPLPGTTYAGARWSTLAYVEKVRPQFLSLRQLGRSRVFSARTC